MIKRQIENEKTPAGIFKFLKIPAGVLKYVSYPELDIELPMPIGDMKIVSMKIQETRNKL